MSTNRTALIWIGFGGLLTLAGGCQQREPMAVDAGGALGISADRPTVMSSTENQSMWERVLVELELVHASRPVEHSSPSGTAMPQLVAGDWLAFECAIVGGYWDMSHDKSTPAYAEVPESWSIVE